MKAIYLIIGIGAAFIIGYVIFLAILLYPGAR